MEEQVKYLLEGYAEHKLGLILSGIGRTGHQVSLEPASYTDLEINFQADVVSQLMDGPTHLGIPPRRALLYSDRHA